VISLRAEWLDDGALPIYDLGGEHDIAYILNDQRVWQQLAPNFRRHRLIVPLGGIDCLLTEFEEQLPSLVETMRGFDGGNGTIYFPIRLFGQINMAGDTEDLRWCVIAGLAYVPNSASGTPLEGVDPVQAILQALRDDPTSQAARDARASRDLQRIIRQAEIEEARGKSRALLEEFLDDEQKTELVGAGCFHVQGLDGYRYQIRVGQAHNVFRVADSGQKLVEYCLVTKGLLPVCDLLLTQKILLETDPETFHATANAWKHEGGERIRLNPPQDYPPFRHRGEEFRAFLDEQLEVVLWRPDTIPRRLNRGGETEHYADMPLAEGVHVAGERVMAGEPADGATAPELVPDLGGAGDGLGIAAVGTGIDAAGLDVRAPEAAPPAEENVPLRLVG
jgi:hypothetical protein